MEIENFLYCRRFFSNDNFEIQFNELSYNFMLSIVSQILPSLKNEDQANLTKKISPKKGFKILNWRRKLFTALG